MYDVDVKILQISLITYNATKYDIIFVKQMYDTKALNKILYWQKKRIYIYIYYYMFESYMLIHWKCK